MRIFRYLAHLFVVVIICASSVHSDQKQTMPVASIWGALEFSSFTSQIVNFIYPYIPRNILVWYYRNSAKRSFLADVQKYQYENRFIPEKSDKVFRVMNFNIRMWTNLHDEPNRDSAIQLIRKIDPDIILLQEVVDWEKTYEQITAFGYDAHAAHCITKDPAFGVAIFAKNCTILRSSSAIFKHQQNEQRELCYVRIDAEIGNKTIAIYNTHLEVDQSDKEMLMEDVRAQQLQEILEDAQKSSLSSIVIAGDLNSIREQDYNYKINDRFGWDILNKSIRFQFSQSLEPKVLNLFPLHGFKSSFEMLGWKNPHFTNWTGRAVDFMFLSKDWHMHVTGSYIYYTAASDHLPIITDFNI